MTATQGRTAVRGGGAASALPESLRQAWGVTPPPRAGRRPGLTVAQIVDAAVELADADGLAASSMPRVAAHLGVGTMSLYRYVTAKNDLLTLMLDAATGPVPDDAPTAQTWRRVLTYYATCGMDRYQRRPWMLDVPIEGFPQTPHLLSWLELGLATLARAGLAGQQQLGAMLLLDSHVNATARLARAGGQATTRRSEPPVELMDPAGYPALISLINAGALRDDALGDYGFQFGLDRILAGIELLMHQPGSSAGTDGVTPADLRGRGQRRG
jgi:AcrR family transcriptional regulator